MLWLRCYRKSDLEDQNVSFLTKEKKRFQHYLNLTLFCDFFFEVSETCIYLFSSLCAFCRSLLWFTENYQHPDRLYLLSPPNPMAWKKKQNKPIRKVSYGPQRTHFLPGMRASEGRKTQKKSKSCLSWKWEEKPRRRSALLSFKTGYELEALPRLRITSSTCAALLGAEGQRLDSLLRQFHTRGPLTSFRITQHHALII